MSKVEEIADKIVEALEDDKYARADRLQLVLVQLVKIQVAEVQGKTPAPKDIK